MKIRPNIARLPVDQITVGKRLRRVDNDQVDKLIMMAEDTGITTPIHVRKTRTGYILIDGAHRLEAATRMGIAEIAALVVECRADEALAMEASNNLGAAKMSPLQTAVFFASWKRTYYQMHPERKRGAFKGNQYTPAPPTDKLSVTKSIADSYGVDERTVYRVIRVGESLKQAEIELLYDAPSRITMEDLKRLAKINTPADRSAVVAALASGAAKSARDALKAIKPAEETKVKLSPEDQQWRAMCDAFTRAKKPARRMFVKDHAKALRALLAEIE